MILFSFFTLVILLSTVKYKKISKYNNILYFCIFVFIFVTYCVFSAHSCSSIHFLPKRELNIYFFTGNFYNWLMTSFFNFKLNLDVSADFVNYLSNLSPEYFLNQSSIPMEVKMFYDTSIYNDKIYLYFGITPIILFYAPFYLITHFFLSDQIVFAVLSILIFVLQLLIFKKILLCLIQSDILKKDITEYFTVTSLIILSLCNAIPLTYIDISVHSIAVLTSIFCQLVAIYFCLLLQDGCTKIKMFIIGLFLSLAVGSRPSSVILLILFFILMVSMFNIKKYYKQYMCFFIPVIIYGTILAVYNYLRFNSVFDFGFLYQFSPTHEKTLVRDLGHSFPDYIKYVCLNIFNLPRFSSITPLCLFNRYEPMIGGMIACPIIFFLLFIKSFYSKAFGKNKYICFLFSIMLITSLMYLLTDSYIGSNARYVAEYLFLILIPSIVSFYFFVENTNNIKLQKILNFLFLTLVFFSLYVNINLMNCIFLLSKEGII